MYFSYIFNEFHSLSNVLDIVEVLYAARTISVSRGSSVTLPCNASYNLNRCGLVHVVWLQNNVELVDPDRYLTTVSEIHKGGNTRHRQVLTEILKVGANDTGAFQCKAECGSGESAKGHTININVQGKALIKIQSNQQVSFLYLYM